MVIALRHLRVFIARDFRLLVWWRRMLGFCFILGVLRQLLLSQYSAAAFSKPLFAFEREAAMLE
jgi:hypothetical protein